MLGDDGRYHLFRGDVVLCTEISYTDEAYAALGPIPRADSNLDDAAREALGKELVARITQLQQRAAAEDRARHGGRVPHEHSCYWWTDETTYRMSAPKTASREQRFAPLCQRVWWAVRLLGDPVDPSTVPPSRRCVFLGGRSVWPPYLAGESRMGRIRRQLVDLAGPMCHACGLTLGIVVDHDHFTGHVRGLLCWTCNAWIDECPHLDGCPRADYLNNLPARHLRIRYPLAHRDREHDRARIDYLGIDPFPPTRPYRRG